MYDDIILDVRGVSKKYVSYSGQKTVALDHVDFKVRKNEMIAVMGRSGSGKSTLVNIITGILDADEGEIYIDGKDIFKLSAKNQAAFRRKHFGIVFQNYNLIDSLTIDENIRVPLILDEKNEDIEEKVIQISEVIGISDILSKYPYEISGGQQQRAGICRALINEPKIIFADEPTGNLDAYSAEQVMHYFTMACKKKGASVLIVTHDAKVASYCDKVIFLCNGRIEFEMEKESGENMSFYTSILDAQKEVLA